MDALDVLEQQHRDISELLAHIGDEPSPGARTRMVVRVARMIDAHSLSEERCLYAALRDHVREACVEANLELFYRAMERHAVTRFAAEKLLCTRATDVRFRARLELVRETFGRHADAEEDWVFQRAKRDLTDEQLDVLGDQLLRVYDLLLAPSPQRLRVPRARGKSARSRPRLAA